jgi:hypothetical protein
MKQLIRCLAIGSRVTLGEQVPEIMGRISAISVRGAKAQYISYEVTFWAGDERKTEWVQPCEVEPMEEVDAAAIDMGTHDD